MLWADAMDEHQLVLSKLGWHWPVSTKQKNYPEQQAAETIHYRWRAKTLAVLLIKKKVIHTLWVSATIKSNKRRLTSLDLNAKVIILRDGGQVSGRSRDSLDCLLSKWSDSRSAYQPTRTPVHHHHQQVEAMTNSSRTQQTREWTTTYETTWHLLEHPCFLH